MRHIATDRPWILTKFKTGSIASAPVVGTKASVGLRPPRGAIADMSVRSRLRAAWAFANAECDWGMMATLTYAKIPRDPKDDLKRFGRAWRAKFGASTLPSWIMEFQDRGACHFHLFFDAAFTSVVATCSGSWLEVVYRDGVKTELVRGGFDQWICSEWGRIVGDTSLAFRRFQGGGIVELLRSPDAAARYVAKEAGKRAQKELPEGMQPQGRWWWLNPRFKPRPRGRIDVKHWPYERHYRLVFDTEETVKKSLSTPNWKHVQVTTSYNMCAAKTRATLRRTQGSGDDVQPAAIPTDPARVLVPDVGVSELFDYSHFGTPD